MSHSLTAHSQTSDDEAIEQLTIYVPGAKGGGYDHTAKVLRDVLLEEQLVKAVQISYVIGAGGTLALTHFINTEFDNQYTILLGGRSMIGAALYNNANVSILETAPIARLTGKPLAIAVASDSPINTVDDLFDAMYTNLSVIKWVGGSAGAADSIFLKDLFKVMHLDYNEIDYHPVPGGGSAVAEKLISVPYTAAVSTLDELIPAFHNGLIKVIAVTSSQRVSYLNAPTLQEKGVDLSLLDWHGVFVSQRIDANALQQLDRVIKRVVNTKSWQNELQKRQWKNNFVAGIEFEDFIKNEQAYLIKQFSQKPLSDSTKREVNEQIVSLLKNPYRWAIYITCLCLLLLITLFIFKLRSTNRENSLQDHLKQVELENKLNKEKLAEKINGISRHVDAEFEKWQLTNTEREIALMLLKGLTFKDIAQARCKSERTVRQQAGAIYAKSSLANRSDLAAHFLDDFMTP